MNICPLSQICQECSNKIAIYSDEGIFTYRQLDDLIVNFSQLSQVFFAPISLTTVLHFFSLLRRQLPALPISPQEANLPSINLSKIPSEIATLLFTSGTTGKPKLVMQGLQQHLYSATHLHQDLKQSQDDRYLISLPLNHIGGIAILFRAFFSGASIILGNKHKHLATHVSFVPTQLKRYLKDSQPYPHLKALLLGGAPIPEELCHLSYQHDIPLYLTYGMTETCSQFATARYFPDQGIHFGKPLEGRFLSIDEQKVISVRGQTLFSGYFGDPPLTPNDWFRTADLGHIGPYGLEILGRCDRVLISGGENISLDELESVFLDIDPVKQVVLSKRACPEFGERPVVHLTLSRPIEVDLLRSLLAQKLARFKIPNREDFHIHVN